MENREKALAKRHSREREKWSEHTAELKPLETGDHVYLQNLTGNYPLRWERTGVVVEVKPFNQYVIRLDFSGRVTLRNRKHLRQFTPFSAPRDIIISQTPSQPAQKAPLTRATEYSRPASKPAAEQNGNAERANQPANHPVYRDSVLVGLPHPVDQDGSDAAPGVQPPSPPRPPPSPPEVEPGETVTPQRKLPLALRRLQPHNQPGRKE